MMDRYHRQTLLPQIGPAGQARLGGSRVLLVGCGALGSVMADQLVRAGVGHLRIADRDIVELSNLQRQVLFDEADARDRLPKAEAAARRLGQINSIVQVEPLVVDLHSGNIEELVGLRWHGLPGHEFPSHGLEARATSGAERVDVILDGTDNAETRYLVNDVAVKHGISWVYGGCVGVEGRVMAVTPGVTPCLRCLFPTPPARGELPTCDTAGVLGPAAAIVASLQAVAAIQLLTGQTPAKQLLAMDLWNGRFHAVGLETSRRDECLCCGQRHFEFLDSRPADAGVKLCGRQAIQIQGGRGRLDLHSIAAKLAAVGEVQETRFLVRCGLGDGLELTVFADGRAIVQGTEDLKRARSIYARYVGV